MQKHKKWLIVTIWISTIAFVGAGFVGWGSYDYGKSNSTVAIVGDKQIPLNDLQNEYSALYSQYQSIFGKTFNKELAKQLNLENIALQKVIQKYLILNYADQLGLITTDEEVAKELVKIPAFLKDGKFNKNQYMQVLKQNRRTIAQFEAQLKQDILVQKVQNLFDLNLTKSEINNIGTMLYSKDKVSIKVINTDDIKVKLTNNEIKAYWQKTKDQYKSQSGYDIVYTKIQNIPNNTKKQMRKVALKLYVKSKKDQSLLKTKKVIYDNSNFFDQETMQKISTAPNGKLLKPVYKDNNYYIVKLVSKLAPKTLPFKDVKAQVKEALSTAKKETLVAQMTKKELANFKGKDIGYISRDQKTPIANLNQSETVELVKGIFASNKTKSSVKINNKIVLFNITDTKTAKFDKTNTDAVQYATQKIKTQAVLNALLKHLEIKYEIKSFMKE
jgi:peptidyl-prolyl cis-trans isomerase D